MAGGRGGAGGRRRVSFSFTFPNLLGELEEE